MLIFVSFKEMFSAKQTQQIKWAHQDCPAHIPGEIGTKSFEIHNNICTGIRPG